MEFYTFIHDPEQVKHFLAKFLPQKSNLAIQIQLVARRKYDPRLSQRTTIVNRVTISGGISVDQAYRKVMRMQVPVGSFLVRDLVPSRDAFVLYAMISPKDTVKAMVKVLTHCVDDLQADRPQICPPSAYQTVIGKTDAVGFPKMQMIDLDSKDPEVVKQSLDVLKRAGVKIEYAIETKNGYHIVYHHDDQINRKMLYEYKISTKFKKELPDGRTQDDYVFSIAGCDMVVIPGTYQGGFEAKLAAF